MSKILLKPRPLYLSVNGSNGCAMDTEYLGNFILGMTAKKNFDFPNICFCKFRIARLFSSWQSSLNEIVCAVSSVGIPSQVSGVYTRFDPARMSHFKLRSRFLSMSLSAHDYMSPIPFPIFPDVAVSILVLAKWPDKARGFFVRNVGFKPVQVAPVRMLSEGKRLGASPSLVMHRAEAARDVMPGTSVHSTKRTLSHRLSRYWSIILRISSETEMPNLSASSFKKRLRGSDKLTD